MIQILVSLQLLELLRLLEELMFGQEILFQLITHFQEVANRSPVRNLRLILVRGVALPYPETDPQTGPTVRAADPPV